MGERDAFGNEKGEDTLSGLGWTSGGRVPSSEPPPAFGGTPSTPPPSAPDPSGAVFAGAGVGAADANEAFGASPPTVSASTVVPPPPGIPRVNGAFGTVRLVGIALRIAVPLVVLAIVGGTVFSVGSKVSDSVSDVRRAISTSVDSLTTTATTEAPAPPKTAPVGLGKGSLLKAGNFRKALALLRPEGSRARLIRVTADRLDATLVTASGYIRQVQVTWEGERRRVSQTGPGFSQASTFPIARLDVRAPARLTRSAAGRVKAGASKVDYLVAISTGIDAQGWTAILKDNRGQFLADPQGRITRRIS